MTVARQLPALDWKVPMVDPQTGRPSPGFQRFWQNVIEPLLNAVSAGQSSGWDDPTGTSDKTAFVTYTAPSISNPPTQAEVQALADHVQILSRHMKPLIEVGLLSGLLSP